MDQIERLMAEVVALRITLNALLRHLDGIPGGMFLADYTKRDLWLLTEPMLSMDEHNKEIARLTRNLFLGVAER